MPPCIISGSPRNCRNFWNWAGLSATFCATGKRSGWRLSMASAKQQTGAVNVPLSELAFNGDPHGQNIAAFLENMMDGFVAIDGSWKISYINAEAERLLDVRHADLLGSDYREKLAGIAGPLDSGVRRAMDDRVAVEFETYDAAKRRWLHVKAAPAAQGGVSVYFDDITVRKDAEKATALLGAIIESSDDAIVSKTLEGVITSWNK